jgi:small-conductance mechanosensitive channel
MHCMPPRPAARFTASAVHGPRVEESMPNTLLALSLPVAGVLVGGGAGYLARRLAGPSLRRLAARTTTTLDNLLVEDAMSALPLWGALAGLRAGMALFPAPANGAVAKVVVAVFGVSVAWTLGRLAGTFVASLGGAATPLPSAHILRSIAQASVFVIGVMLTLSLIGVSVAPILTALGVGGLAVGLALQDTLANLFAGFHILVSRQVRTGDFIRLATGEEGYVEDITWRYTTIRRLPNDLVIVPNAKLASAVTANFSLPSSEQAILVQVGVAYEENLERVERVTTEVAQQVMRDVEGGVPEFAPFIRYHTFADNAINFTVILRGKVYTDQYLVVHEFIKRLHRRYRDEYITIPYPQRTLHFEPHDAMDWAARRTDAAPAVSGVADGAPAARRAARTP